MTATAERFGSNIHFDKFYDDPENVDCWLAIDEVSGKVIARGATPKEAHEKAQLKNVNAPFILKLDDPGTLCFY